MKQEYVEKDATGVHPLLDTTKKKQKNEIRGKKNEEKAPFLWVKLLFAQIFLRKVKKKSEKVLVVMKKALN